MASRNLRFGLPNGRNHFGRQEPLVGVRGNRCFPDSSGIRQYQMGPCSAADLLGGRFTRPCLARLRSLRNPVPTKLSIETPTMPATMPSTKTSIVPRWSMPRIIAHPLAPALPGPFSCLTRALSGRNMAALETRVLPAQVWPGIRWDLASLLPRLTPSVCPRL